MAQRRKARRRAAEGRDSSNAQRPASVAGAALDRAPRAASSPGFDLSSVPVLRGSAEAHTDDSDVDEDEAPVEEAGYEADDERNHRLTRAPRLTPEQRQALRKIPRRVTRTDATVDNPLGSYGKSDGERKSHRAPGGDLAPAGPGVLGDSTVTTTQHLLGHYPAKGASSHTSFSNTKRVKKVRDYSQAKKGEAPAAPPMTVTLAARKLAKARLREKEDVQHTGLMTTKQILADVAADPDVDSRRQVTGYVNRDAEVHSLGRVPRRFVRYSDRDQAALAHPATSSDSDSDSVSEEETDYSD